VRSTFGLDANASIIVGIDRMDYTKGVPEKFRTVERLLERRPDLRGRVVLLQVAEPSRDTLDAYREIRREALAVRDRVNRRFGNRTHQPIVMLDRHFDPADVFRLYRAADVCYVNSLHDGMNLVAKEFAAARCDERGVLVLSQFAGASRQLGDALPVNPYAIDRSADTLERALCMSGEEQRERMRALRRAVLQMDSTWWANGILADAIRVSAQPTVASAVAAPPEVTGFNWNAGV
jgi:trehalose 6-phosphate synthase